MAMGPTSDNTAMLPCHGTPEAAMTPSSTCKLKRFAIAGTVVSIISFLIKLAGLRVISQAIGEMNFKDGDDANQVVESITSVTSRLGDAGTLLGIGNLVLLLAAILITSAFRDGGFRAQWFIRSTFAFALLNVWHPLVGTGFGIWCLYLLWKSRRIIPVGHPSASVP